LRIIFTFLSLFFAFIQLSAQASLRLGVLPSVNITRSLHPDWSMNLNIEHRAINHLDDFKGNKESGIWQTDRTDIGLFASHRLRIGRYIAGGYMARIKDQQWIHRLRQQYTFVYRNSNFRWAHRIVTDQTFSPDASAVFRFRNRIAIDLPLEGSVLDPREFYLKGGSEYLVNLQDQNISHELRFVPVLGYALTDNNKFEAGIDYRWEHLHSSFNRNSFWFLLQWYFVL
jgi:hypothetical protein